MEGGWRSRVRGPGSKALEEAGRFPQATANHVGARIGKEAPPQQEGMKSDFQKSLSSEPQHSSLTPHFYRGREGLEEQNETSGCRVGSLDAEGGPGDLEEGVLTLDTESL